MIIDGKAIATKRLEELGRKVVRLRVKPKLAAIIVGDDPGSEMYVRMKAKRAGEVGIVSEVIRFKTNVSGSELIKQIQELNDDRTVTGILVQLPLPGSLNTEEVLQAINPKKDVDGLTGKSQFLPATVKAVLICLESALEIDAKQNRAIVQNGLANYLKGKITTVIGQGKLVGKKLADYLEGKGLRVRRCDINTRDLSLVTREADVLVVATGVSNLIKADMVKPGAIVIDCGAPKAEVDFDEVSKVALAITPVPGGVGPLTVVSLLENTLEAYGRRESSQE